MRGEHIRQIIDKYYIDKETNSCQEYNNELTKSLEIAGGCIENIIILYREIYSLSNRLPHEFLYKRK